LSRIQSVERSRVSGAALFAFLLAVAVVANVHLISAYTPQHGDYLKYSETTTVNNGQGSYSGYTDQTLTTGTEQMNSVSGDIVSSSYSYAYQYSSSQGSSSSGSSAGNFTWSSGNFTYDGATDNEQGFGGTPYSSPSYVWFAMNSSLPVGSTFHILNSQFTVLSKNYTLQMPTENEYVQTIQTESTGQYQRNDAYGTFAASYTWYEYFDPTTGYIVAYNYVEQDNGQYQGQAGSFAYTDTLYITSTSYPLIAASAPSSATTSSSTNQGATTGGFSSYLGYAAAGAVVILLLAAIAFYVARRGKGKKTIPEHSPPPYAAPPVPSSAPFQSEINLGSQPPEQVVIREVAKVKCKYCGTLIPSTADTCPYCGGPQR
jgi:hypothetical protein